MHSVACIGRVLSLCFTFPTYSVSTAFGLGCLVDKYFISLFHIYRIFILYAIFKVRNRTSDFPPSDGLKWTRTTDLTLIRRAL